MNLHLVAGAPDAGLLDSPLLQGLELRVASLSFEGYVGPWLLVDLSLEWLPGLELIGQLRQAHPRLGILVTGAGRDVQACVQGYQRGADFFMNQAVMHEELMAAVHARVRTEVLADFGAPAAPTQAIEIDGLRLEMRGPMAQVGLTSSEFKLLKAFARSPGQALRTEEIRHVIEPGAASQASQARQGRLTVLIHRLRRKLMQAGADARAIRAQRKQGYELVCRIRLHDPLQPQAGRPRA